MLRTAIITSALAVTMAAAFAPASAGFGSCSEPNPPWCIDNASTFEDKNSFASCRREVDYYTRRVDSYVNCLRDEQSRAIERSNKTISKFNCMASGASFCM